MARASRVPRPRAHASPMAMAWLAWRCLSLLLLLHATTAGCATSHRRHSRQA